MNWDDIKLVGYRARERYYRVKLKVLNPRNLLQGMLVGLFILFMVFVAIQKNWFNVFSNPAFGAFRVDHLEWVPTIGVYLAASGWIIGAIVTIRNSVKQHTINTLLQSRLSKTYIDEARLAQDVLANNSPTSPAPVALIENHADKASVDYLLNYLEFVAVGIRHGDLHEEMLRDTIRGIVTRLVQINQDYIKSKRVDRRTNTFENIIWLYNRWRKRSDSKIKW